MKPQAPAPISWAEEVDIIHRAIALRKLHKLGILHAEFGHYWICAENESDPHVSRVRVSLGVLKLMVEAAEKKQPQRETSKPLAKRASG